MQWDATANAGFSTAPAEKLYLPVDPAADRPSVAAEASDPQSSLNATRALIALRKAHPALGASGEFREVLAMKDQLPFVFERAKGDERILVALNPAGVACERKLPTAFAAKSVRNLAGEAGTFVRDGDTWLVRLPAVSFAVVQIDR
jgi:maltose alpha-D-glucosyltransferase/alpha-amylase